MVDCLVKLVGHNDRSPLRWLDLNIQRVESERFFFWITLAFPQRILRTKARGEKLV